MSAVSLALLSTPAPATPEFPAPARALPPATAQPASPVVTTLDPLILYQRPERLVVPALGIDDDLIELGLNPDRTLEVPIDAGQAGWYKHSVIPGRVGPAIIAGHVSSASGPGIFYSLHLLQKGDEILVHGKRGSIARFAITKVERYPKADFPTQMVYGNLKHPGIRLITCGGAFNSDTGHFLDNVIVFGRLVFQRLAEGPN
jgi:sortase (surface protein transpeptidase)